MRVAFPSSREKYFSGRQSLHYIGSWEGESEMKEVVCVVAIGRSEDKQLKKVSLEVVQTFWTHGHLQDSDEMDLQ